MGNANAGNGTDAADRTYAVNPTGTLNAGPHGLGFLVAGGYMPDAASLYCPSVGGSMPCDPASTLDSPSYENNAHAVRNMSGMRLLGGTDAQSIMFGDWSSWANAQGVEAYRIWNRWDFWGHAMQSDYHYRNVPVLGILERNAKEVELLDSKPKHTVQMGCAPWKTQKQLAGRAIVTDSFSQWYDPAGGPIPGVGHYAHREGYNVLYGDWHATWYGDPQQNIMWWHQDLAATDMLFTGTYLASLRSANAWSLARNCFGRWEGDNVDGIFLREEHPSQSDVWHQFDVSAGVDVDAAY